MPTITTSRFPLKHLDDEHIVNKVYLGDEAKNIQIFTALKQGKDSIDKLLPNHFEKLNKCVKQVSVLVYSSVFSTFAFENDIKNGYSFLMLKDLPNEQIDLSNTMNYAQENLYPVEASMVMNIFAYGLLCEESTDDDEQYFAAFMVDYIKELAHFNKKNVNFDISAFLRFID
jgi:hypothetical protein